MTPITVGARPAGPCAPGFGRRFAQVHGATAASAVAGATSRMPTSPSRSRLQAPGPISPSRYCWKPALRAARSAMRVGAVPVVVVAGQHALAALARGQAGHEPRPGCRPASREHLARTAVARPDAEISSAATALGQHAVGRGPAPRAARRAGRRRDSSTGRAPRSRARDMRRRSSAARRSMSTTATLRRPAPCRVPAAMRGTRAPAGSSSFAGSRPSTSTCSGAGAALKTSCPPSCASRARGGPRAHAVPIGQHDARAARYVFVGGSAQLAAGRPAPALQMAGLVFTARAHVQTVERGVRRPRPRLRPPCPAASMRRTAPARRAILGARACAARRPAASGSGSGAAGRATSMRPASSEAMIAVLERDHEVRNARFVDQRLRRRAIRRVQPAQFTTSVLGTRRRSWMR